MEAGRRGSIGDGTPPRGEAGDGEDWETASTVSDRSHISTASSTVYAEGDVQGKFFSRVRHNRSKEVEQMLDSGLVTVDQRGDNGMTPLMAACLNGHKRVVKALLKRFAAVNAQDSSGLTALHYCYRYGHRDLAEYLVSKGADDTLKDSQGLTCYAGISPEGGGKPAEHEPAMARPGVAGGPSIAGYSLEEVAAAAASVARNTGAGTTVPFSVEPSGGAGAPVSWQPNAGGENLTVNTVAAGPACEVSPSAALSLSPGSSPESWSSLKANVSVGGSQGPSFMQNLDDMVMMEKARQRAAKANLVMGSGPKRAEAAPSRAPAAQGFAANPQGYPAQMAAPIPVHPSTGFQGAFAGAPYGAGMAMPAPVSINDSSPRRAPKPMRSSKPRRAPLPMCAEGDDERSAGAEMMSVVVDTQATPPASLDHMPDMPAAAAGTLAPGGAPVSGSFLDLEGVGNALVEASLDGPAHKPPQAPQLFTVAAAAVPPQGGTLVSSPSADSAISDDSGDET